ncbi:MAG: Fe-Mn family superoxide dismutase [Candidatus Paceibacterota bacterium]|jgi:Fe-Mn family superoxide dismutase
MYISKNYDNLLGLEGFSENALKTHFTLYQGYVSNTNKLVEKLQEAREKGEVDTPEYAEIQRRLGWEFNGMRLHEYYFESMSKETKVMDPDSALVKKIENDFGSFENWEKDFRATASMRGIGWAILYYDKIGDRLINFWINEHYVGHPAGCVPLLPLDVFEHAFMLDYGTKRADYIGAFMKVVDWNIIQNRFK